MIKIQKPYLIFVGEARDDNNINTKIADAVSQWNPEQAVGYLSIENSNKEYSNLDRVSLDDAIKKGAKSFVLGLANNGGYIQDNWKQSIYDAIDAGLDIVNGMHDKLENYPEIVERAEKNNVELINVRHNIPELKIGNGKKRSGKRILAVGTDCSTGKMYSTLALTKEMQERNINCTFRATGQTGIIITGDGVPIDAVVCDFISGMIENLTPDNDPEHFDIIEGQGSLFHPSYAGVTLGLIHGSQPDYLILCHSTTKQHVSNLPEYQMPSIVETMELCLTHAKLTNKNCKYVGISVNTSNLSDAEAKSYIMNLEAKYNLPVTDPVRFGISNIVDFLESQS